MKFDKPNAASPQAHLGPNDKYADGTTPAQRANCKAIYENPEAYREWRLRMGLSKKDDDGPIVNHAMRARVAAEFRKLGVGMGAVPDERKLGPGRVLYALPDKSVPVGASDALKANNMRRERAEKSLPF